jgi:hypothetical protein
MNKCTWMCVLALSGSLLWPSTAAAMILLDSFDNGSHFAEYIGASSGNSAADTLSDAWADNPIGNARTLVATRTNSTGGELSVKIDVQAGFGHTRLTNDSGAAAEWTIDYGTLAPLNLDLTGETALRLTFDQVSTAITTSVTIATDTLGTSTSAAYFTPLSGVVTIDFEDFAGGLADLSDVDAITFRFDSNGAIARDATLTSIEVVPEPAQGIALLACSMSVLARRRRLRR